MARVARIALCFLYSASAASIDILAPDSGNLAAQLGGWASIFNAQPWALGNNHSVRIIHATNINETMTSTVDADLRREKRFVGYAVVANMMPTWAHDGLLEDLSTRVEMDPMLEWGSDVLPLVKYVLTTFGERVYTMPLDADHLMGFARTDVLNEHNISIPQACSMFHRPYMEHAASNIPDHLMQTWDDFLEAAQALNGTDMNGDGVPDFPVCLPTSLSGMYTATFIMAIIAPFVQVLLAL
jgi:hypothetical protein